MVTIKDVAKTLTKTAGKALYPGVPYSGYKKTASSKAFDTGALLSSFVQKNRPETIVKKTSRGYRLIFDLSLPSPKNYGVYVHYGTYKMDARPFVELGTEDPAFELALNQYFGNETLKLVEDMLQPMDTQFKAAGFKVS